jgi:ABC-type transport system involved in multi-copper enzyme maturation permease subunit
MSTTVLANLILFMGFITFLCGAFGILMLFLEEVSKNQRYAMGVGLISGGLGMIGIGQGLRLLLLILGKVASP